MAARARGSKRSGKVRGFGRELTRNSAEVVAMAGVAQRRRNSSRIFTVAGGDLVTMAESPGLPGSIHRT